MRLRSILVLMTVLLALGGYLYFSNSPEPASNSEPRFFMWKIDMQDLQQVEIQLPRENKSQAFILGEDGAWYFDDPQRSEVDSERWGGGIPALLSGPGADRVIKENATEEEIAKYGLSQPQMVITLTLMDGKSITIIIGDKTPIGDAYVQVPGSNKVATVDYTWYNVIERLVTEPPYAAIAAK